MKKILFRYRLLPSIILVAILTTIFSALIDSGIYGFRDSYNATSVYANSNIDFVIPSPSKTQCLEMESFDFIEKVVPYYYTNGVFLVGDGKYNEDVVLLDDFDNIEYTPYNTRRCIRVTDDLNGKILVDYYFSKLTGLKLGNKLQVNIGSTSFAFEVGGIYETNSYFKNGACCVVLTDVMKDQLENFDNSLKYSSAFICASDVSQCQSYLMSNYKPLGLLRPREDFDTDESYELFIQGFNETDYSNEIFVTSGQYEDSKLKAKNYEKKAFIKIIIALVFFLSVLFVWEMVFSNNTTMKKRIKSSLEKGEKKKDISSYLIASSIIQYVTSLVVYLLITLLFMHFTETYIKRNIWISVASLGIIFIVSIQIIYSLITIKKFNRNWN